MYIHKTYITDYCLIGMIENKLIFIRNIGILSTISLPFVLATGDVDFIGTFHRIWENHLAELVECRTCGRKFFPDRIEKHERACNNLPLKIKKN